MNYIEIITSREDQAMTGMMLFHNLEAGEHELRIEADGCETYTETINVVPGEFDQQASPIRMQRK